MLLSRRRDGHVGSLLKGYAETILTRDNLFVTLEISSVMSPIVCR